jgi:hypothetical protein
MQDWFIPGLYVLVYLDPRIEGLELVRHIDLERPFVVCPDLKGTYWRYLRQKLKEINTVRIVQTVSGSMEIVKTSEGAFSSTIHQFRIKARFDLAPLIGLMFAHSFLTPESLELFDATDFVEEEIERVGFTPEEFYSEIIKVDLGTAGLHEYCLFGGPNTYVKNVITKATKNDPVRRELMDRVSRTMNADWHAKIASYLGIILWSKVKVNPLLRESLIDYTSYKHRKKVTEGLRTLATQALLAYARKPI